MKYYEEIIVPPAGQDVNDNESPLILIEDLDNLCRGTFKSYKGLNRVQSLVYPVAYNTNENMLICAPTGAVCLLLVSSNFRVKQT
jgi:antiviral helicase SLH1